MRYKVAPAPPGDVDGLFEAQRAVPLVPESTDDCCARLQERLDLTARESAREWLGFLEALALATETDRGFERRRGDPDPSVLGERFRTHVFGARELCSALEGADGPLTVEDAFAAVRESVPTWERNRHEDWEAEWRDRVQALLEWAVLFGLADREGEGYVTRTDG
jgi:hypothetical protein